MMGNGIRDRDGMDSPPHTLIPFGMEWDSPPHTLEWIAHSKGYRYPIPIPPPIPTPIPHPYPPPIPDPLFPLGILARLGWDEGWLGWVGYGMEWMGDWNDSGWDGYGFRMDSDGMAVGSALPLSPPPFRPLPLIPPSPIPPPHRTPIFDGDGYGHLGWGRLPLSPPPSLPPPHSMEWAGRDGNGMVDGIPVWIGWIQLGLEVEAHRLRERLLLAPPKKSRNFPSVLR